MKPTKTKRGSVPANKILSEKLGRSATALLASGAATLAASGSAFALVFESPDFSNTFPGFSSSVGETYQGGAAESDVDFFSYSSLNPGDNFDLGLNYLFCCVSSVSAQQATGTNTFVGNILTDTTADGIFVHLTGIVPGDGNLSFRVSTTSTFFEAYQLTLNTSSSSVPEPATAALLLAGLAGALVTRRRRREQTP